LKGDVLSYYTDASNLYFPHGQIDLRYGISAEITDKKKDCVHFSVVTAHRTYHFRADSAPSAKEWVKCLQRVIFRSHNDGDSVKISLPLANVIDIEDAPTAMEFADTAKIRVIDNDETFAIDEYFFSFFSRGSEAKNVLKVLIDAAQAEREEQADPQPRPAHRVPSDPTTRKLPKAMANLNISTRPEAHRSHSGKLHEGVKATLSPMSPASASYNNSPRASGEYGRPSIDAFRQSSRRSLDLRALTDAPRRSFSSTRRSRSRHRLQDITADQEPARDPEPQGSSESYLQSMEDPSQASFSALVASSTDDPSASQILRGSDVFHGPTIHQRASSATRSKAEHYPDPTLAQPHNQSQGMAVPVPGPRHAATTGHFAVAGDGDKFEHASPTTPTLQNITKMGAYPLQRAAGFASYLNNQSRRMSNLLATESMGYVEKVHGMWKGGRKHYDDPTGLRTDDEAIDDDPVDRLASGHRFRAHFALPDSETLQAAYFGYIMRVLPLYGKIYISDRHFCFRSLLPGTRTKLVLPLQDIENANKEKGFRFGYSGLVLVIRGHEELFFEFSKAEIRDDCTVTLLQNLEHARLLPDNQEPDLDELDAAEFALAERDALKAATTPDERPMEDAMLLRNPSTLNNRDSPIMLFDDPRASFLNFKPPKPLRITCLTIGSRGDVQPYIALALGLMAEGHSVKIATHEEFQPWIEKYGIAFANVGGDPGELMRLCIENGTFTWAFLKEANAMFRGWLDELLVSTWSACQGSDLLIESPSAMAGIHIAEALGIPYFRAFTMPWTRTRAYPHPFIMPEHKMGGAYNLLSYSLFDTVFWRAMQSQINRWRRGTLGLPNTTLEKLQPNKVPFLYNFSPSFVPPPLDYSDWIHVTGYWFLDEGSDKTKAGPDPVAESTAPNDPEKQEPSQPKEEKKAFVPDPALVEFIAKARADDKKIVYVGFGSIIVPDVAKMTQEVIDAVLKADVRCILSKGWSEREDHKDKDKKKEDQSGGHLSEKSSHESAAAVKKPAPVMPAEILVIKSAPHDWLFAQIDAAAHHGGAGTTGASIRAGIPTIVRPFFGDQFFSGTRVEDLGVGIYLKKWGAASFARAMWEATHSHRMISRAAELGRQIRMVRPFPPVTIVDQYADMLPHCRKTALTPQYNASTATWSTQDRSSTPNWPSTSPALLSHRLRCRGCLTGVLRPAQSQ
jgi:sterol 3beta-glucosyltransferase